MKRLFVLFTLLISAVTLSACELDWNVNDDPGNGPNENDLDGNYNAEVFEEVLEALQDNHYQDLSDEALYEAALRGLFDAIDDPHTNYMTQEERQQFRDDLGEEFVGVGITIERVDEDPVVTKVWTDSPAERAGMMPGDVITHIDGDDYSDRPYHERIESLLGEEGTTVEVGVERPGTEEIIYFTMERESIPNPTVVHDTFEVDGRTIGHLEINSFGEQTAALSEEALDELENDGIDGLIVDLRDNTGGYLAAVDDILDMFLTEGEQPMFTIEQRVGGEWVSIDYDASGEEARDYDIVTLINGSSASASEVFAAGMKEKGGYEVFGEPSFGKGTMQQPIELSSGSYVNVSLGRWLTPSGQWVDRIDGDIEYVEPTEIVEQNPYLYAYNVYLRDGEPLTYDTVATENENVQAILNALGADIREDGYFDEDTREAVEDFQNEHDLEITGEVDEATAAALSEVILEYRTDLSNDYQLQFAKDYFDE